MVNYRLLSHIIKNTKKPIKNVSISKNNKINNELFKNNKEPSLNISIMDPHFSNQFWKMHEKKIK